MAFATTALQRPSRCHQCSEYTSAFAAKADMAGLATGSTQSRMDPKETSQVTSIIATVCARPLSPRSITVLSEVVGPTCGNVFFNLSGGLL